MNGSIKFKIMLKKYFKNIFPFLREWLDFLPLLFIYFFTTILFSENIFEGDEGRYMRFSENLLNGYYAMPNLKPGFLWNGPGYPLIISPLTLLDSPLIVYKILNSIFLFYGIIYIYKSLRFNFSKKTATIISYFLGLTNPYYFIAITRILTESLVFFLISFSLFHFIKFINSKGKRNLILFILSSGLLILTKVFFSYVFLTLIFISIIYWIFKKHKDFRYLKLSFFPLFVCIPYLIYTHNITGKLFYWSDAGGSNLYCMSTPYENEYGDWFDTTYDAFFDKYSKNRNDHIPFFKSIEKYKNNGLEYDKKLKEQALLNITRNPSKYFKNWIFNISRTFTNSPKTNKGELKISVFQPLNTILFSFILVLFTISCFYYLINYKNNYISILVIFCLVYLGGISLISSMQRFLLPVYPIIIFIIVNFFQAVLIKKNNQLSY